ncbi:hypothetical protein PN36_27760 [Candidatus Thiomargarita nelsonii]|uniref:Uncharacterized protein n=1 Tax=Candidatus Thiomargarita nelsonii TaxID=1003181 RepID=A0A4E0QM79_9GAMM|nr:hypothetical protein PN36_27760 [Candidatus Thiomargarita nelsonii]
MKKIVFYIIKPKAILVNKVREINETIGKLLTEVTSWQDEEVTHSGWTNNDYIVAVKLVYLAYLYEDLKDEPDAHFLFNSRAIRVELFDKWWSIERYELSDNIREAEHSLDRLTKKNVQLTGNRSIDTWLLGKLRQLA